MPKRKLSQSGKFRKRRKYKRILPDIGDDDIILNGTLDSIDATDTSLLLEDEQFINESGASSLAVSDEEAELPEGLINSQEKEESLKAGDLVWIKHQSNSCYWPCYIRSVTKKQAFVYYLSYNKFTKGEKSFRYNVNSKKIKRFDTKDYHMLVEEGKKYNKDLDSRNGSSNDNQSSFMSAVELAQMYVSERGNKSFSSQIEIFKFFSTDGLSLCYAKCVAEHNQSPSPSVRPVKITSTPYTPMQTSPPLLCSNPTAQKQVDLAITDENTPMLMPSACANTSPIIHRSTDADKFPHSLCEDKLFLSDGTNKLPTKSDMKPHSDFTEISPPESPKSITDNTTPNNTGETLRRSRRKRSDNVEVFNRQSNDLVCFIIDGECDKYLIKILESKVQSQRMKSFCSKWSCDSIIPKKKTMAFANSYFEDETQLEVVCSYLQNFINNKAKQITGLVKQGDLLFNVFLPEATVYSIQKLRRRTRSCAEKLFINGCNRSGKKSDPSLCAPLTDEERSSVHWRIDGLKHELT